MHLTKFMMKLVLKLVLYKFYIVLLYYYDKQLDVGFSVLI